MQHATDAPAKVQAARRARKRAGEKYPTAWYQDERRQQAILLTIGVAVTVYQWRVGWGSVPRWFVVLGMGVFLAGWVADTVTTARAFGDLPAYRRRGLAYPIVERNPFLPDFPTVRNQLLNPSSIIKLAACLLTLLLPAAGWGGAWSGVSAALNNRRNAQSVRFQLQQYDLLMKELEKEKRYPRVSRTRTGLRSTPGTHHHRFLFS